ncbi:cupin domain-containing protein [Pseudotabrizicola sp. 4114]|uniref:cupin domain-containing protein n=1 Tax=Pseudotabrizicola sp. 4114 TaxID=2817731 RepID=UPI0032B70029
MTLQISGRIAAGSGAGSSDPILSKDFKEMTTIVPINPNPDFAPRPGAPAPDRLIEGNPLFSTWAYDDTPAGDTSWSNVLTGVWEATPGLTHSIKGTTLEFCHILKGRAEITSVTGESWTFGPGDSFVMKPGFVGTWRTIETVRKIYVVAQA